MGQVFRRETNFDKLFEEFAIDPEKTTVELIEEKEEEIKNEIENEENAPQQEEKK